MHPPVVGNAASCDLGNSNLSGNLLITFVNQLFVPSPALQIDAVKEACSWQTTRQIFILNFMHYVQKKITRF